MLITFTTITDFLKNLPNFKLLFQKTSHNLVLQCLWNNLLFRCTTLKKNQYKVWIRPEVCAMWLYTPTAFAKTQQYHRCLNLPKNILVASKPNALLINWSKGFCQSMQGKIAICKGLECIISNRFFSWVAADY